MPNLFQVRLTVRNAGALLANFHSMNAEIQAGSVAIVARIAERVREKTAARAAYDTGFMHDNVRKMLSAKGLTYTVGWFTEDFVGKVFYPPYPEFGTSRQSAQPALMPSAREGEEELKAEIAALIARATA